ncbi:hypothetical protein GY45DRAFT_336308 [Cubamyces sp. BRFM 1775]|nr:hypothetical protein GY45DRAFT_336308 [Cubamyces sp. BRFM 1775]
MLAVSPPFLRPRIALIAPLACALVRTHLTPSQGRRSRQLSHRCSRIPAQTAHGSCFLPVGLDRADYRLQPRLANGTPSIAAGIEPGTSAGGVLTKQ